MNILVVRTDKLGDFVTALPALYVLKEHDPKNTIIACVAPLNRALAEECSFIDEVIIDSGQPLGQFVEEIRGVKADVSITLFSNTRVALAQFLARIPNRIAPATKLAQLFYNQRVKQRRSQVEMAEYEYNLELTKVLFESIETGFRQPLCLFEQEALVSVYENFCTTHNVSRPVVAFHPGFGGSSDANWTLQEYVTLVKLVAKNPDVQVVMTFGPGEEDLYSESLVLCEGVDVVFYQSTEGIVAFTKLLASFKLFVSTSTGTYHLAALVNIPTMTFFGDSLFASVKRWKAVSAAEKQHPFMLPEDVEKRTETFLAVQKELMRLTQTL